PAGAVGAVEGRIAGLNAVGATGLLAVVGDHDLADADLAVFGVGLAGVEAAVDLDAGGTLGRVVDDVERAAAVALTVLGAEVHGVDPRGGVDLAATEAVAAVGHQRSADVEASLALHLLGLLAIHPRAGDRRVGVVVAAARVGLRGIAAVTPITLVVAGPGVLVEVAIHRRAG